LVRKLDRQLEDHKAAMAQYESHQAVLGTLLPESLKESVLLLM